MEGKMIGPGPYRATKLWNETITLFRGGMPLRRHWAHFRSHDNSFTGSEAVDWLHELLRRNHNFGPEVTRYQSLQLLKKFLKNHVIEDVKGRHGTEDFEDNGQLYRFPPTSPLKLVPPRRAGQGGDLLRAGDLPRLIRWDDYEEVSQQENVPVKPLVMNSESWNKRHSIAIGEVPQCKLIRRREITPKQVDHVWKSMTIAHLQRVLGLKTMEGVLDPQHVNAKHIVHNVFNVNKTGVVVLKNKAEDMPYWVLSAMKCLANWPNGREDGQPSYPGFERDVLRTVAEYFHRLREPLLTFHLYDVYVCILSLEEAAAVEAVQVCSLLLPPANRRRLQLLLRLMTRVCLNPALPPLNPAISTRTLMVQTFARSLLGSADEADLDELLATKLLTFLLDHHDNALATPPELRRQVDQHLTHLRRVQIKYPGADADSTASPAFYRQVSRAQFEQRRAAGAQGGAAGALQELLEGLVADRELCAKDKRKRLKQFQKSYPEIYRQRFPTAQSEAAVLPEKERGPRLKPQRLLLALKNPLQPFQRSWSFRA